MSNLKIELNKEAVRELLLSDEVAEHLDQIAEKRTRATGVEYVSNIHRGRNRVNAGAYQKAEDGKQTKQKICPKCGHWHPNCTCKK